MTNSNSNNSQEIYAILTEIARRQLQTQEQIDRTQAQIDRTQAQIDRTQAQIERTQQQLENTQDEVRSLANDITRVLGRDAVLNDVLLELRDSHETMKENFIEHQRTTNAALNSLEAINLRLIEIISRE